MYLDVANTLFLLLKIIYVTTSDKTMWQNNFSFSVEEREPFFTEFFYPVDTGRNLNVHKILRGRLLNVLCMFNSRALSKG